MQIRHHKRFVKSYAQLSSRVQRKARAAVQQLTLNPHEPRLRNHALAGDMRGRRAFSVTGDIRIIFREEGGYERVTLLEIGTHNQVYR